MDEYPEYKFTCSQAQQFAWLKEDHPELFARIKERAKEGRFIPIGGTWVEMVRCVHWQGDSSEMARSLTRWLSLQTGLQHSSRRIARATVPRGSALLP